MISENVCFEGVSVGTLLKALLIRETEMGFLRLFVEGRLHGTVHTCVGQEFSALAFAGQLQAGDFVFSNHRGHGHYLAFTNDLDGLVAELMGRSSGVCGGIGSSQHLCAPGFFTNGIQGGILPCATGHALASQFQGPPGSMGVVFIGDGTLGEGIVYESLNLMALLGVPLLVVCEDNGVAQSTPQSTALAGSVRARAEAFGVQTWSGTADEPARLLEVASEALRAVRESGRPGFFHLEVARLNAHSKGDDERLPEMVTALWHKDFLQRFAATQPSAHARLQADVRAQVEAAIAQADSVQPLSLSDYLPAFLESATTWRPVTFEGAGERMVTALQKVWAELMARMPGLIMLGEDIRSPYGGAFKVTRGLSDQFPDRVINTPISEAAITGIANGLALAGMRPVVEIMFGDFLTLALDQLLNHAAKFHHMYHRKARCPLVLRTPMGGGRGYGPTHSQSLEKLITGIDTLTTVALHCFGDPARTVRAVMASEHPVVIIENKLDYGRRLGAPDLPGYIVDESTETFPTLRLRPCAAAAQVTLVTYGGQATVAVEAVRELFAAHEVLVELLILTQIGPIIDGPIIESVRRTGMLATLEEGTAACGIGAEIIARVAEAVSPLRAVRIAALPIPIPSPTALEALVLPGRSLIVQRILSLFHHD
jgi:2-oxoisovalerate dehydrogenase E1 component